jgi:ATP-dependent RNA helicase DDX19/DBP5
MDGPDVPPGFEANDFDGYVNDQEDAPEPPKPTSLVPVPADANTQVELAPDASVSQPDEIYKGDKSWEDLSLPAPLLRGIYDELKFERPSKIQSLTLPLIAQTPQMHLIAQGHNGSGKTTCFALAMLSKCAFFCAA